jgi:hypothetical protein
MADLTYLNSRGDHCNLLEKRPVAPYVYNLDSFGWRANNLTGVGELHLRVGRISTVKVGP